MSKKERPPDAGTVRSAMLRRNVRRSKASGSLTLPAIPALVDHYTDMLDRIFTAVGRPFTKADLGRVRDLLAEKIDWAYQRAADAWIVVEYSSDPWPKMSLTYTVTGWHESFESRYENWVATRKPPLFGTHADARALELARSLGEAGAVTCLDVGAGTGRNAIPLALAGHPVDAIEPAVALSVQLETAAKDAGAAVRVMRGHFEDEALPLRPERYRFVLLAETSTHFRGPEELRKIFVRLAQVLAPGGVGLMNVFVASPGYTPDALARQLSQYLWCPIFTRQDLEQARAGLPLELVSDEAVAAYEREHLPPEAWPPTGWFEDWTGGRDLFDLPAGKPPMEMRWLTYARG
jgi:SAM-dependent methyltransferase